MKEDAMVTTNYKAIITIIITITFTKCVSTITDKRWMEDTFKINLLMHQRIRATENVDTFQMFQLPGLEDAKVEVDHRHHQYQFRYSFIWNRTPPRMVCQRVKALDTAALLPNSTIVLINMCWHHQQHSALSQSIKKMESCLSSKECHKSSLDEGWIESLDMVWCHGHDPDNHLTFRAHLAWNPGHGTVHRKKAKLAHWVDLPPTMKTCIKSTLLWIPQISLFKCPPNGSQTFCLDDDRRMWQKP